MTDTTPNLSALRAERKDEFSCLVCDLPLPRKKGSAGRQPEVCDAPNCERIRQRAYELDYLERKAAAP